MSIVPRNRLEVHSDPAHEAAAAGVAEPWSWPDWTDDVMTLTDPDGGNDEDGFAEPTLEERAWWASHDDTLEGEPVSETSVPFADWIRAESSMIRLQGGSAAKWLADELDYLAALAAGLGAETPDTFLGRRDAEEKGRDSELFERGYRAGVADGQKAAQHHRPGMD